jgi:murein L,D-transpeptidase YcbB/YkuD
MKPASLPCRRHIPAICVAIGLLGLGGMALAATDPGGASEETLVPATPLPQQDAELLAAIARYRQLSGNPAWQKPLPPIPDNKLTTGQPYAGMGLLVQRLGLLGDLPANTPPAARYEGKVVDGIKSFQERHGLTPDGVIGKGTFEQLNIAPEIRVRQLELALERLRSTALPDAPRAIVVNVPEFRLRAYEIRDGKAEVKAAMNVIVGNAQKTRTPLFEAEMQYVEFSPYWNVPPSIAKGETLPKLRHDPAYFDQQGFEFVDGSGRVVGGFSEANLDAVLRGQMRIRQRPGAKNALGDIKFVFPNPDNIYLHHTPTPQLFKKDRRDFSHGCIRVEEPVELAKFVLADDPEWTEERIVQAMTKGRSATLRLRDPFPVIITYTTAVVRDGRVYFFPDIYGHDKILDDAVSQRQTSLQPSNTGAIGAKSRN